MSLEGTPSDRLPDVLATGETDVQNALISFTRRHSEGRDAEYLEWHSLDHRPEQYRLRGMRHALRAISTPACRAARAASHAEFDATDHMMIYMSSSADTLVSFLTLREALEGGGRWPMSLPRVGIMVGNLAGKAAAPAALVGADVIPWRPALGLYVLIEEGRASPEVLTEIAGVAGVWWFDGMLAPPAYNSDARGRRATVCFLDKDPVETATRLKDKLRGRWAGGEVQGLFAAPFYLLVPFDWGRHLPA